MPEQASGFTGWTVPCQDEAGADGNLSVDVNGEFRVVLHSSTGQSTVMSWQDAETLRAHLAAAVSMVLRGERR